MTYTSVFDLFTVGIGPSSSHTVGPMVAARRFASRLRCDDVARIEVELFGSLALTGRGHGTPNAVLMGLAGYDPETVPLEVVAELETATARSGTLRLDARCDLGFDPEHDIVLTDAFHPAHANVLRLTAFDRAGAVLREEEWASIGGGFVVEVEAIGNPRGAAEVAHPFPFRTARELLELCRRHATSIAAIAMANETALRSEAEVTARVEHIVAVMFEVIERGVAATGALPGGLGVPRRARQLAAQLEQPDGRSLPPTGPSDWAGVWATAVGEENAAGHRVVTAPTNGAAGIIPAVLRFMADECEARCAQPAVVFLLTATVVGSLLKANAGISGAELGCQGEVGSACAMAAAGLAATLGGSPQQVENAAEIALEHNLGLTCDPLGGLVQIPCIERNAIAAVKAISAASLALRGSGEHIVSLDAAIATLRQTGTDMDRIYKETSLGGLAVNVPEC